MLKWIICQNYGWSTTCEYVMTLPCVVDNVFVLKGDLHVAVFFSLTGLIHAQLIQWSVLGFPRNQNMPLPLGGQTVENMGTRYTTTKGTSWWIFPMVSILDARNYQVKRCLPGLPVFTPVQKAIAQPVNSCRAASRSGLNNWNTKRYRSNAPQRTSIRPGNQLFVDCFFGCLFRWLRRSSCHWRTGFLRRFPK